jgi:hypothetical protein
MVSESARMSSASEARFRVDAPNSRPRTVKVIALDAQSEGVVSRLAEGVWNQATFLTASAFAGVPRTPPPAAEDLWLRDLAGGTRVLKDEVDDADLVIMVAFPGGQAQAASIVGEACSRKRVMTTALVAGATSASDETLAKTLAQLRPWSLMIVIADADEYIDDMLRALRA